MTCFLTVWQIWHVQFFQWTLRGGEGGYSESNSKINLLLKGDHLKEPWLCGDNCKKVNRRDNVVAMSADILYWWWWWWWRIFYAGDGRWFPFMESIFISEFFTFVSLPVFICFRNSYHLICTKSREEMKIAGICVLHSVAFRLNVGFLPLACNNLITPRSSVCPAFYISSHFFCDVKYASDQY